MVLDPARLLLMVTTVRVLSKESDLVRAGRKDFAATERRLRLLQAVLLGAYADTSLMRLVSSIWFSAVEADPASVATSLDTPTAMG